MDGSPVHGTLITYTIGRLGAISPPHRDALQHRGLRPANLRRLLCDVKYRSMPLGLQAHTPPLTLPIGTPTRACQVVVKWDYMFSTHSPSLNLVTPESNWQFLP